MTERRQLHLNLNFMNAGSYSSAWRWPESQPRDFLNADYFVRQAQVAERGTFDAIFLADNPVLPEGNAFRPFQSLEPTVVLATIAAKTSHIGLIATASTSYNDPYNVARRFASLDHLSGGRVGWNIVTTAEPRTGANFGQEGQTSHAVRYDKAIEFADVVSALWDSWEDAAFIGDQQSGRFIDERLIHNINHRGEYFSVAGPLNVPRTPQGRPIFVQAGGSDHGMQLAARHADLVFSVAHTLEDAIGFSQRLGQQLSSVGRRAEDVVICPGLVVIIGGTEQEAKQRERDLWETTPIEYGLLRLAATLQVDPERLSLDEHLPDDLPFPTDHRQTFFKEAVNLARRDNLTVRQLIKAQGGGGTAHRIVVGTPEQIAAGIEQWFLSGAIGGFNVMPDVTASGLPAFVDEVVPILRRRGIFRSSYEGRTLRENLGLATPANRFAQR
ncbi:MAG: LLM class flavin-dependent oxidoreductase [Janthinobacterium lividum]